MTEDKHRNWDILIKLIGGIITIITIMIGVYQYKQNNEREYRKRIYDEQFEVYNDFIVSMVKLSKWKKQEILKEKKSFKIDYNKFEQLYYGRLRLMQTGKIDSLATTFYVLINKYKSPTSKTTETDLDNLIGKIIIESKKSLQNTWNTKVKELK